MSFRPRNICATSYVDENGIIHELANMSGTVDVSGITTKINQMQKQIQALPSMLGCDCIEKWSNNETFKQDIETEIESLQGDINTLQGDIETINQEIADIKNNNESNQTCNCALETSTINTKITNNTNNITALETRLIDVETLANSNKTNIATITGGVNSSYDMKTMQTYIDDLRQTVYESIFSDITILQTKHDKLVELAELIISAVLHDYSVVGNEPTDDLHLESVYMDFVAEKKDYKI